MPKFDRTRKAAGGTYRYVRDDLLNAKEAQGHYEDIKNLASTHLDPRGKRVKRQETFAHAMERMGLKAEDIEQSYRFYNFRFNLFSVFLGACVALAAWGAAKGNWMLAVGSLAPALIFLGQLFNASFRCFQIRRHELLPVSAWWANKAEWIPGEYTAPRGGPGGGSAVSQGQRGGNVHHLPTKPRQRRGQGNGPGR